VYLFNTGMLHAKMMVVDNEWSTVGSTNFDFRSFEHNYECNAFIYSADTNARLKEIFFEDQKACTLCDIKEWRERPRSERMLDSTTRLFSPIL
jgi:cardiolipin synthase